MKKDAKPQDVFVFYYAGHGYINPANKEFYLVSADVADGGESLLKNGIPAKDLQQYAVDIQVQKQLFILDACQSAGAFEAMLQHDGEQQKSHPVCTGAAGYNCKTFLLLSIMLQHGFKSAGTLAGI